MQSHPFCSSVAIWGDMTMCLKIAPKIHGFPAVWLGRFRLGRPQGVFCQVGSGEEFACQMDVLMWSYPTNYANLQTNIPTYYTIMYHYITERYITSYCITLHYIPYIHALTRTLTYMCKIYVGMYDHLYRNYVLVYDTYASTVYVHTYVYIYITSIAAC